MTINHLLIVEDDELLATQTARAMQAQGLHCHCAHSGTETIELLDTLEQLDAAVLDQNLGNDNGLDLISPILARFPACRIVLLTGYGSITAAVAATHRGAHNYLTKPASAAEIVHALTADPAASQPLPDSPPSLERLEWEHIQRTLDAYDGNVSRAAQALGMHRRTLQRRLKKRPSATTYHREKPR